LRGTTSGSPYVLCPPALILDQSHHHSQWYPAVQHVPKAGFTPPDTLTEVLDESGEAVYC
jgi:hypothetical protein